MCRIFRAQQRRCLPTCLPKLGFWYLRWGIQRCVRWCVDVYVVSWSSGISGFSKMNLVLGSSLVKESFKLGLDIGQLRQVRRSPGVPLAGGLDI